MPKTRSTVAGGHRDHAAWRRRSTARRCCGAGDRASRVRGSRGLVGAGALTGSSSSRPVTSRAATSAELRRRSGRRPEREPIEPVVQRAAERPVGLDTRPGPPSISPGSRVTTFTSPDSACAVAGGEGVGDQRRLAQQIRRNAEAEAAAGRRIELVLDAEPVEDERLLADPAATVARAHGAGARAPAPPPASSPAARAGPPP